MTRTTFSHTGRSLHQGAGDLIEVFFHQVVCGGRVLVFERFDGLAMRLDIGGENGVSMVFCRCLSAGKTNGFAANCTWLRAAAGCWNCSKHRRFPIRPNRGSGSTGSPSARLSGAARRASFMLFKGL